MCEATVWQTGSGKGVPATGAIRVANHVLERGGRQTVESVWQTGSGKGVPATGAIRVANCFAPALYRPLPLATRAPSRTEDSIGLAPDRSQTACGLSG